MLELLSYIEGYLLVNGQKIKAGYADKAGSVEGMEDMFLHKDRADGTPFPITFGDWVKFGEFITGISGGCIDKNGILEMEEGIFRKRLFVPEIAYNRVTYFKGRMCASPGGGCTVKEWTDNGDGTPRMSCLRYASRLYTIAVRIVCTTSVASSGLPGGNPRSDVRLLCPFVYINESDALTVASCSVKIQKKKGIISTPLLLN